MGFRKCQNRGQIARHVKATLKTRLISVLLGFLGGEGIPAWWESRDRNWHLVGGGRKSFTRGAVTTLLLKGPVALFLVLKAVLSFTAPNAFLHYPQDLVSTVFVMSATSNGGHLQVRRGVAFGHTSSPM